MGEEAEHLGSLLLVVLELYSLILGQSQPKERRVVLTASSISIWPLDLCRHVLGLRWRPYEEPASLLVLNSQFIIRSLSPISQISLLKSCIGQ